MGDRHTQRLFLANRRDVLKSAAVASIGGTGLAQTASADSSAEKTITVKQGDERYEVTPLQNGETISDFYNYYNVESHTTTGLERSDTSLLFFWEGPNGLSLVIIHDRADDTGGGDVTFEFEGLPDDGSWVVRDDNPGNDRYIGNSEVDWQWNYWHTDGAAFRDVSGAEFTINPRFFNGIDSWELLSGDASTPERIELDLGSPVTVSVGGTVDRNSFEVVRDEKLALASQVDSLARDFDERPQVVASLDALETGIYSGNLKEETAVEAVERLKLGENVTEELLADFGPETLGTEDPDSLVGNSSDATEYNTALGIVQSGINIITEAVLSFFPFDKVVDYLPSGLVSKIDTAKSKLTKFVDFAVDTLLGSHDELARQLKNNAEDVSQFILETIRDQSITEGSDLARKQTNEVAGIQDSLADLLVGIYEDDVTGTPVEERLEDLNESLTASDGSLSLAGDLEGAQRAADNGIDDIKQTLGEANETTDTISDAIDIVGWLGLIAGALLASGFFSIAGATLNLVLFIFNVAANLLGIATGALAMVEAVDEHNAAIDGVVDGGI